MTSAPPFWQITRSTMRASALRFSDPGTSGSESTASAAFSIPAGKPVTRTVVLFLASASGQSVSVTSSNPWLHAAMDRPTGPGSRRLLSVTLTGLAPAGPIQGRVTVALADWEHLDIPVVAELTN